MTGTDSAQQAQEFIYLSRSRIPKLVMGHKSVIDYSRLDRREHSKMQTMAIIPHKSGEVLKVRAHPKNPTIFASINQQGPISLYSVNLNSKSQHLGQLMGLTEETFALDRNK